MTDDMSCSSADETERRFAAPVPTGLVLIDTPTSRVHARTTGGSFAAQGLLGDCSAGLQIQHPVTGAWLDVAAPVNESRSRP